MKFPFKLPIILDGATGTNLIAKGLPSGVCVEKWILDNPNIMMDLQKSFIKAGTNAIYTPTFGANRAKLKHFGLDKDVERMNLELVSLTKSAVGNKPVLIGGDISPAGLMIRPYGEASFDELLDIYLEQATALKKGGVDFLIFETQMSLADMRAGVLAAKQLDLPVFVTMTVQENGRTIMGSKLLPVLITLEALGASAVGINCSTGPEIVKDLLKEVSPHACIPLIAKPNAGQPDPNNPLKYSLTPKEFAEQMKEMFDLGIGILGGCCGTTPEHIKALNNIIKSSELVMPEKEADFDAGTIEGEAFFLGDDIVLSNPIECSYDMCDELIDLDDESVSAAVVEVNTIEDAEILIENTGMTRITIDVLASNPEVLEFTLKNFQGRLMVDSESAIDKKILKDLSKKYGAILY